MAKAHALAVQRGGFKIRRFLPRLRTGEDAWRRRHPFQDLPGEVLVVVVTKPQHCLYSSIYSPAFPFRCMAGMGRFLIRHPSWKAKTRLSLPLARCRCLLNEAT